MAPTTNSREDDEPPSATDSLTNSGEAPSTVSSNKRPSSLVNPGSANPDLQGDFAAFGLGPVSAWKMSESWNKSGPSSPHQLLTTPASFTVSTSTAPDRVFPVRSVIRVDPSQTPLTLPGMYM